MSNPAIDPVACAAAVATWDSLIDEALNSNLQSSREIFSLALDGYADDAPSLGLLVPNGLRGIKLKIQGVASDVLGVDVIEITNGISVDPSNSTAFAQAFNAAVAKKQRALGRELYADADGDPDKLNKSVEKYASQPEILKGINEALTDEDDPRARLRMLSHLSDKSIGLLTNQMTTTQVTKLFEDSEAVVIGPGSAERILQHGKFSDDTIGAIAETMDSYRDEIFFTGPDPFAALFDRLSEHPTVVRRFLYPDGPDTPSSRAYFYMYERPWPLDGRGPAALVKAVAAGATADIPPFPTESERQDPEYRYAIQMAADSVKYFGNPNSTVYWWRHWDHADPAAVDELDHHLTEIAVTWLAKFDEAAATTSGKGKQGNPPFDRASAHQFLKMAMDNPDNVEAIAKQSVILYQWKISNAIDTYEENRRDADPALASTGAPGAEGIKAQYFGQYLSEILSQLNSEAHERQKARNEAWLGGISWAAATLTGILTSETGMGPFTAAAVKKASDEMTTEIWNSVVGDPTKGDSNFQYNASVEANQTALVTYGTTLAHLGKLNVENNEFWDYERYQADIKRYEEYEYSPYETPPLDPRRHRSQYFNVDQVHANPAEFVEKMDSIDKEAYAIAQDIPDDGRHAAESLNDQPPGEIEPPAVDHPGAGDGGGGLGGGSW